MTAPALLSLLADDALALRVDADTWPAIAAWYPQIPAAAPRQDVRLWIDVKAGTRDFDLPAGKPQIQLCNVAGWSSSGGRVLLAEPSEILSVVVDPAQGRA